MSGARSSAFDVVSRSNDFAPESRERETALFALDRAPEIARRTTSGTKNGAQGGGRTRGAAAWAGARVGELRMGGRRGVRSPGGGAAAQGVPATGCALP